MREVGVTEETLKPLHKFLETALAKMEEQLQAIEHGGSRGESVQGMQGQRRAGAEGGKGGGEETPTAKALFMVKDILTKADMLFKNTDDYKMALQQRTIREPGGGGRAVSLLQGGPDVRAGSLLRPRRPVRERRALLPRGPVRVGLRPVGLLRGARFRGADGGVQRPVLVYR
jgi:hypothetical protein